MDNILAKTGEPLNATSSTIQPHLGSHSYLTLEVKPSRISTTILPFPSFKHPALWFIVIFTLHSLTPCSCYFYPWFSL
jgi:hypothetical protein